MNRFGLHGTHDVLQIISLHTLPSIMKRGRRVTKGSSAAPETSPSVSDIGYVRTPIDREEKKIETASSAL